MVRADSTRVGLDSKARFGSVRVTLYSLRVRVDYKGRGRLYNGRAKGLLQER